MSTLEDLLVAWSLGVGITMVALSFKFLITVIGEEITHSFGNWHSSPTGEIFFKSLFWPIYLTFLLLKVIYMIWKFFRDLNTPIWRGWD
jgi:hypothetical protein